MDHSHRYNIPNVYRYFLSHTAHYLTNAYRLTTSFDFVYRSSSSRLYLKNIKRYLKNIKRYEIS